MNKLFKKNKDLLKDTGRRKEWPSLKDHANRWPGVFLFNHYHHYFFSSGIFTDRSGRKTFSPTGIDQNIYFIVDAILVITLAPVLISFFMKGKFRPEAANPVNRLWKEFMNLLSGSVSNGVKQLLASISSHLLSVFHHDVV